MPLRNYIPQTGIGGFDLQTSPGSVTVTIRVQPVFSSEFNERSKENYKQNFVRAVKETWENKCVLVNGPNRLKPKFEINFTDQEPHYIAMVDNNLQGQPSVSALKAKLSGNKVDEIPKTVGLPRYAYLPAPIVQKPDLAEGLKDGYPRDIIRSWYEGLKYFVMDTQPSLDHCAKSSPTIFSRLTRSFSMWNAVSKIRHLKAVTSTLATASSSSRCRDVRK